MNQSTVDESTQLREIYKELGDEHTHLLSLLGRIKGTRSVVTLLPMLEELHGSLLSHFARETYPGGFYESMGVCQPEYRDDLRVLVDEHFRMLSSLRGLIERARIEGAEGGQEIVQGVSVVANMLHSHERKEHDLASRVLGT